MLLGLFAALGLAAGCSSNGEGAVALSKPAEDADTTKAAPPVAPADADKKTASRVAKERQASTSNGKDTIASIARDTWIHAAADTGSPKLGSLRAGAVVPRSGDAVPGPGCPGGFYAIEPRGFVCHGKTTTLDTDHPVLQASERRPERDRLPYDYVIAGSPGPRFYTHLPTREEQAFAENDLSKHLAQRKKKKVALPSAEAIPEWLTGEGALPNLADDPPRGADLVLGRARHKTGLAIVGHYDHEGRRFGLTPDLLLVPLDRTRWVKPSTFSGLHLDERVDLPVAFVMRKKAKAYSRSETGKMKAGGALDYREAISLTGRRERGYVETHEGTWLRAKDVRVVEPMKRVPTWAADGKKWIDVSILEQSLVAYEGTKPVFVTLVSTGADGLGDPEKSHATVRGSFLIHTKHVTATMDSRQSGEEFELRDVPFVQYFSQGYAIHAAYWHDDFGKPRSHGCVNLSPLDAAWLFSWTTPDVPATWHSALSEKSGTLVYTHP